MDLPHIPLSVHTPFADLDLLYGEEREAPATVPAAAVSEPETVDALNAQILAGLVFP